MLTPKRLIAEYETMCENPCPRIRMPVKRLIAVCIVFFILSVPSGILLRRGILALFEFFGIF